MNQQALSSFIWSIAELLRGDFKQSEYGKVILPFTVLRRLDCVLAKTKEAVLEEFKAMKIAKMNPEPFLLRKAGQSFYNTSKLDLVKLLGDPDQFNRFRILPATFLSTSNFKLKSIGSIRRACFFKSRKNLRKSICIPSR
jgi:type I restriction-modification system DNA methylase subunit